MAPAALILRPSSSVYDARSSLPCVAATVLLLNCVPPRLERAAAIMTTAHDARCLRMGARLVCLTLRVVPRIRVVCLTLRVVPRIMPLLHALSRTVAVLFAPTFDPPSPLRRYRRLLNAAAIAHERYRCAGTPLPWHAALLRLRGMADGQRCSHATSSLPSRCYDGTRAVHQWTVSQVRMCPLRSGSLPHHHRHHRHLRHHHCHPSLTRMACAPRVLFRSRRWRIAIARSWSGWIVTLP